MKLQVSVMFLDLSLDNTSSPFPVRASEELEPAEELELASEEPELASEEPELAAEDLELAAEDLELGAEDLSAEHKSHLTKDYTNRP